MSMIVRSVAGGLRLLNHKDIVKNYKAALRWRPRHKKAVLVPCAGTKPFSSAPSHEHGYLDALGGKSLDYWIVSEPLGIVPYSWEQRYPNDAYDFPPKYLRGKSRTLLIERFAKWFDVVAPKYSEIFLALPGHHLRLIKAALKDSGVEERIVDVSHISCGELGRCERGHGRSTSGQYKEYLRQEVNPNGGFETMDERLEGLRRQFHSDPYDFEILNAYHNTLRRLGVVESSPDLSSPDLSSPDLFMVSDILVLIWNLLYNESSQLREDAAQAIGNIGPKAEKAVPALIEAFKDEDRAVRFYAAGALGNIGPKAVPTLIEALKDKEWEVRWHAAYALGQIGSGAEEAVPALIETLKDEDEDCYVRSNAAEALGYIGAEEAIPTLIEALKDERVRFYAKWAFDRIRTRRNPNGGFETLDKRLEGLRRQFFVDPYDFETLNAYYNTLRRLGVVESSSDILVLIWNLLYNESSRLRQDAALAIGEIGRNSHKDEPIIGAEKAVPALIEAFKDEAADVAYCESVIALDKIGPKAVPALIEALKDKAEKVRYYAVFALGLIGHKAVKAVPALIETLKDKDSIVRSNAAQALGNIGPKAEKAVPALIETLKDKDREVRYSAELALEMIRMRRENPIDLESEYYRNPTPSSAHELASAYADMGEQVPEEVEERIQKFIIHRARFLPGEG